MSLHNIGGVAELPVAMSGDLMSPLNHLAGPLKYCHQTPSGYDGSQLIAYSMNGLVSYSTRGLPSLQQQQSAVFSQLPLTVPPNMIESPIPSNYPSNQAGMTNSPSLQTPMDPELHPHGGALVMSHNARNLQMMQQQFSTRLLPASAAMLDSGYYVSPCWTTVSQHQQFDDPVPMGSLHNSSSTVCGPGMLQNANRRLTSSIGPRYITPNVPHAPTNAIYQAMNGLCLPPAQQAAYMMSNESALMNPELANFGPLSVSPALNNAPPRLFMPQSGPASQLRLSSDPSTRSCGLVSGPTLQLRQSNVPNAACCFPCNPLPGCFDGNGLRSPFGGSLCSETISSQARVAEPKRKRSKAVKAPAGKQRGAVRSNRVSAAPSAAASKVSEQKAFNQSFTPSASVSNAPGKQVPSNECARMNSGSSFVSTSSKPGSSNYSSAGLASPEDRLLCPITNGSVWGPAVLQLDKEQQQNSGFSPNGNLQIRSFEFDLSPQYLDTIVKRSDLEIVVGSHLTNEPMQVCHWPDEAVNINFNGTILDLNRSIYFDGKPAHKVCCVKHLCRPGRNTVEFILSDRCRLSVPAVGNQINSSGGLEFHRFAVFMAHMPAVTQLLDGIQRQKLFTPTPLCNLIVQTFLRSYPSSSPVDQILLQNQPVVTVVNLICPVFNTRIRVPGRISGCQHVDVFDMEAYLHLETFWARLECPICGNKSPTDLSGLSVDSGLAHIMALVPKCVTRVQIRSDGYWCLDLPPAAQLPFSDQWQPLIGPVTHKFAQFLQIVASRFQNEMPPLLMARASNQRYPVSDRKNDVFPQNRAHFDEKYPNSISKPKPSASPVNCSETTTSVEPIVPFTTLSSSVITSNANAGSLTKANESPSQHERWNSENGILYSAGKAPPNKISPSIERKVASAGNTPVPHFAMGNINTLQNFVIPCNDNDSSRRHVSSVRPCVRRHSTSTTDNNWQSSHSPYPPSNPTTFAAHGSPELANNSSNHSFTHKPTDHHWSPSISQAGFSSTFQSHDTAGSSSSSACSYSVSEAPGRSQISHPQCSVWSTDQRGCILQTGSNELKPDRKIPQASSEINLSQSINASPCVQNSTGHGTDVDNASSNLHLINLSNSSHPMEAVLINKCPISPINKSSISSSGLTEPPQIFKTECSEISPITPTMLSLSYFDRVEFPEALIQCAVEHTQTLDPFLQSDYIQYVMSL